LLQPSQSPQGTLFLNIGHLAQLSHNNNGNFKI
jgi:hypothetical protein